MDDMLNVTTIWACLEHIDKLDKEFYLDAIFNAFKNICGVSALDDKTYDNANLATKRGVIKRIMYQNYPEKRREIVSTILSQDCLVILGDLGGDTNVNTPLG